MASNNKNELENIEVFNLFKILFDNKYILIISLLFSIFIGYTYYKIQNYTTSIEAKVYEQSSLKIDKYLNLSNKLKYVDYFISINNRNTLSTKTNVYEYGTKFFYKTFSEILNSDSEMKSILETFVDFDQLKFDKIEDLIESFEIEIKNEEETKREYVSIIIEVNEDQKDIYFTMVNFLVEEIILRMNQIMRVNLENTYKLYEDLIENYLLSQETLNELKINESIDQIFEFTFKNKSLNKISQTDIENIIIDKEKIYVENSKIQQEYLTQILSNLRSFLNEGGFFQNSKLVLFEETNTKFIVKKYSLQFLVIFSTIFILTCIITLLFFRYYYASWINKEKN